MPTSWIASDRLMVEKLEENAYKGDLIKFHTSSWQPKSWYLVRNRPPVDYAADGKYEGRGQLSIAWWREGVRFVRWASRQQGRDGGCYTAVISPWQEKTCHG